MEFHFWKQIIITQTCTGSISLLASSVTVFFISLTGLSSPYRRLIFGLSISDICQSFAIVAGPFLSPKDVQQALWGIGNKHSCRLDGFLFLVGMTAVPFYTFALCVYYVCKLRNRMSDAQFAYRVENKMHLAIIGINLILYLTALGMDTINPGVMGNGCFPAAVPTGCRQHPEKYGECDQSISQPAEFFAMWSFFIVPIITLIGIIVCLGALFWRILVREMIFGQAQTPADEGGRNSYSSRMRRYGQFRSVYSSELTSIQEGNESIFTLPSQNVQQASVSAPGGSETAMSLAQNSHSSLQEHQSSDRDVTSADPGENQTDLLNRSHVSLPEEDRAFVLPLDPDQAHLARDSVQAYASEDGSISAEIEPPNIHTRSFEVHNEIATHNNETPAPLHAVSLSRLYKRELITQACCYVAVFCVSTMPFLILNLVLVSGKKAPPAMLVASVTLYPLAGLFNILVYTRPNVGGFRRKHPECPRLQAFWLVLKAGGDTPTDDEWDRTQVWNFCYSCFSRRQSAQSNTHESSPEEESSDEFVQESTSHISSGPFSTLPLDGLETNGGEINPSDVKQENLCVRGPGQSASYGTELLSIEGSGGLGLAPNQISPQLQAIVTTKDSSKGL